MNNLWTIAASGLLVVLLAGTPDAALGADTVPTKKPTVAEVMAAAKPSDWRRKAANSGFWSTLKIQ